MTTDKSNTDLVELNASELEAVSAGDPSHQWIRSGCVSCATWFTQSETCFESSGSGMKELGAVAMNLYLQTGGRGGRL